MLRIDGYPSHQKRPQIEIPTNQEILHVRSPRTSKLDGLTSPRSLNTGSNANTGVGAGANSSTLTPTSATAPPVNVLPDLVLERLENQKLRSPSRRISTPNLDQQIFPLAIRERFKIREMLGSGGYAQVWRVIDRETDEEFAMKVVFKNRSFNQKRLDQEIEALKRVKHPNIISLQEVTSDENHLYIRQELAKGGCLFDLLVESGGFPEEKVVLVMKQLLEAVVYLHEIGIIHRDIKLENILLGQKGDFSTIKLSDFGVVRILEEREKEEEQQSKSRGTRYRPVMVSHVGSVAYMAPEFFSGQKYDNSVDIWACGVMLYIMLSLRSPFGNEDNDEKDEVEQIQRIVKADFHFSYKVFQTRSQEVQDLICKMLKVNSSERVTAYEALQHPWFKMINPTE